MAFLKPATPGTIIVLGATILLVLVSVSVPIYRSIYFLSIAINARQNTGEPVKIYLGVWGYCVGTVCTKASLGYSLDDNALLSLLGINRDVLNLPSTLIKGLTYALVVHPVAAGLAGVSLICGLFAHIRGPSIFGAVAATWFASLASFLAALAFAFDMACFTIAKSRISGAGNGQIAASASYGNAIWLTLASFILLFVAGCCFGCGRRIVGSKRDAQRGDYKPAVDPAYASDTRQNALMADRLRRNNDSFAYSEVSRKEQGLPAFAETSESVPLQSYGQAHDGHYDEESQTIAGVGQGFGRRDEAQNWTAGAAGIGAGRAGSPPQVETFQSMYGSPTSHYPPTSHQNLSATSEYPPTQLPSQDRVYDAQAHPYDPHPGYYPGEPNSPATSYAPSSIPPFGEARQSAVPFVPQQGGAAGHGYEGSYQQQYQPTSQPYFGYQSQAPSPARGPGASAASSTFRSGPPTYQSHPEESPYAAAQAHLDSYYDPNTPPQQHNQQRW